MSDTAPLCACPTPLLETVHSCKRCGHDLAGAEPQALGPKGQAMALLIAERVVEILEAKTSRQKSGRQAAAVRTQLQLGDEA